ncbi:carboxylesterase 1C-like [Psammomys obesus]|uniref:carboxylesterase 1C-like n=1 Tax=Psammomys obesus TaxID=48139 RepID=UPI0024532E5C|nr:carboxylesterase 1C-like [Psammomys obesus]
MVWIHGGGFVSGGASSYDGVVLSAHENVVVVTIQYRLGIWGFFSTGDEHSPGNWGILDQLAALCWLQDNIANFGGDPRSVTIFGESAGGWGVSILVLSPLAKNLFHRAISESGVVFGRNLVNKNTQAVIEDNVSLFVVMDGVVLPKAPEEILAEKSFNTVPYIVGINKQEFGWIIPTMLGNLLSEARIDEKMASSLLWKIHSDLNISENMIPAIIEKYAGRTDDPVKKRDFLLDLLADVFFGIPSVLMSRGIRDAGVPTYMYEFAYYPSFVLNSRPKTVLGDHGDEIFSVFGAPFLKAIVSLPEGASEEETNLSKMVMKFWANFAENGNPNGEGLPHWPEYDQKEGYLQIGATTQQAQRLKGEEVAFWNELLAKKLPQAEHTEQA